MTASEIIEYIKTWNRCSSVKQFHDITRISRQEIKWRTRRLRSKGYDLKLMPHGPTWNHESKQLINGNCLHCLTNLANRPRNLCVACYKDKSIRNQYPTLIHRNDYTEDPTMEQLEDTIAEQSKPENLPEWWAKDVRKMAESQRVKKDDAYYFQAIRCGRIFNRRYKYISEVGNGIGHGNKG